MSDLYRTRTMDQISEDDIGKELKIAGWVENIRDHGGVSFIDLRDMYGVMHVRQITSVRIFITYTLLPGTAPS